MTGTASWARPVVRRIPSPPSDTGSTGAPVLPSVLSPEICAGSAAVTSRLCHGDGSHRQTRSVTPSVVTTALHGVPAGQGCARSQKRVQVPCFGSPVARQTRRSPHTTAAPADASQVAPALRGPAARQENDTPVIVAQVSPAPQA